MPVQDVQIGIVVFQLSLRTWGTREANSRRACLSVSMSVGETNGESKRKTKAATIFIMKSFRLTHIKVYCLFT